MARVKKRVRNTDDYLYGPEPIWDNVVVNDGNYNEHLSTSLNWYTQTTKNTDKKKWFIEWAVENGYDKKHVSCIPDEFTQTAGSVARLILRGFPARDKNVDWLHSTANELVSKHYVEKPTIHVVDKPTTDSFDVKLNNVFSYIDGLVDSILWGDVVTVSIPEVLNGVQIKSVVDFYTPQVDELKLALSGEDDQLNEAYKPHGKIILKRLLKLYDEIFSKLELVKPKRKPRGKKKILPSKQVEKLIYMQYHDGYELKSINPELIVGAKKLVAFNTKTRALAIYYADDVELGLQVKGSTLKNFSDESGSKTIRNVETKIPEFLQAATATTDDVFNKTKAVKKNVTGRINKDTILIKVF